MKLVGRRSENSQGFVFFMVPSGDLHGHTVFLTVIDNHDVRHWWHIILEPGIRITKVGFSFLI